MTFGERLIIAMSVTGITSMDLAKATGMEQSAISHMRSDNRSPSFETLSKVLKAMPNIDARWLILGDKS